MIPASSLSGLTRMQTGSNLLQAFPIQNIPGLGNVQVIPAASLQALTGGQTISSVTQQAQSVLPPGTQIIGSHYLFLYLNFKFIQLFYLYSCFFSWATTSARSQRSHQMASGHDWKPTGHSVGHSGYSSFWIQRPAGFSFGSTD